MPPPDNRQALFFAVLTMATWGAAGSFVRLLTAPLASAAPFVSLSILGGRLALAFVLLAVLLLVVWRNDWRETVAPALKRPPTWAGAALQFVYYALAVAAFTWSPISEIALCASTAPLWVLLIRKLRGQIVTATETAGAFVALSGVAVIVLPRLLEPPETAAADPFPHRLWGDALSLLSALTTAIYALFQRREANRGAPLEPRALSLAAFAFGVPLLVFLRPVTPQMLLAPATVGLFLGLAAFTTVLPTLAFAWASRRLPPVMTATIALLLPVFATSYAAVVLRETPSWTLLPGGFLVICGLLLILRPAKTR